MLSVIRSHPDKATEDLLKILLPIVWERGLRSWVETDLHRLAEAGTAQKMPDLGNAGLETVEYDDEKAVPLGASSKIPNDSSLQEEANDLDRPFQDSRFPAGTKPISPDDEWFPRTLPDDAELDED